MQKFYVYWLIDPLTKKPKYVGVTNHPKGRYLQHLDCKSKSTADWIYYLKSQGLKPLFSIVSIANSSKDINKMETIHIQSLLKMGVELLNGQLFSFYTERVSNSYTAIKVAVPTIEHHVPEYYTTPIVPNGFITCPICGKYIKKNGNRQKYCSNKCRQINKRRHINKAGDNK